VNSSNDLDAALEGIVRARSDAILVFADGVTVSYADRFAAFSRAQRIPSVSGWSVFAEKGNLMTYGPVLRDCYARLAIYADRILKGARAADMPVELPSTHELVINRRTATELGIAIPAAMLARADRIID
jgi:putative ABC transport system substrate-binding protein